MKGTKLVELPYGQLELLTISDFTDADGILRLIVEGPKFNQDNQSNAQPKELSESELKSKAREEYINQIMKKGGQLGEGITLKPDQSQIPKPPWRK